MRFPLQLNRYILTHPYQKSSGFISSHQCSLLPSAPFSCVGKLCVGFAPSVPEVLSEPSFCSWTPTTLTGLLSESPRCGTERYLLKPMLLASALVDTGVGKALFITSWVLVNLSLLSTIRATSAKHFTYQVTS